MKKKLLIAILGHRDSGKSETWKKIFDDPNIRTKNLLRNLSFGLNGEYAEVFLINGSPQERKKRIEDIIPSGLEPEIVLCSIQFNKDAISILEYFKKDYSIYLHWLNPGHGDKGEYSDKEGIISEILMLDSMVGKRDGRTDVYKRAQEVKDFIYDWAKRNNLIKEEKK